jgi:hypothetical protein
MTPGAAAGVLGLIGPQYASGTSDAEGNITLQFPSPSAQQAWTGTITVPGAPSIAVWTVALNGEDQSSWNGSTMAGPFVCSSGGTMTLSGALLPPLTQFKAVWNAQLAGSPYAGPQPVAPLSVALTSLGTFDFNEGTPAPQVVLNGIPGATEALAVVLNGPFPGSITPLVFTCQGVESGAFYAGPYGVNVLNGNGSTDNSTGPPCVVPFSGLFDTDAYLTFSLPPSLAQYQISVYAIDTLPDFGPAAPVVTVYRNLGGAETATLIDLTDRASGPLLLKSVDWTAVPGTSAVAANVLFNDSASGNFYAPLTPAGPTDPADTLTYEATGSHDFKDALLPWYEGGSDRLVTVSSPANCLVAVGFTYQLLFGPTL